MYQVILCEDDRRLCNQMNYFFKMNSARVVFEVVSSGEELIEKIKMGNRYDVFILGNMMRPYNGITIAKELRGMGISSEIILISGVDCFYYDAFEVEAFRYIKKPIDWTLFRKCMQQVIEKINTNNKYFYFKKDTKISKILISDILYFESSRRLIRVVTTTGDYNFYDRLDHVEEIIMKKSGYFIRTHKSYLINSEHIDKYDYSKVYLYNEECLPISENKRSSVRNEFLSYIDGMLCGYGEKVAK